ncbi:zinc finger protein 774-like [Dreissena polymorpha]|uniref:C2H2-type domain-containing protein n=1 Tax=Dreissena polymorpha TaxID=45954 RepID=A0A9D4LDN1_DREPO|nr:zinc finger protein 774-like [Dreissena polymorpha]KAH3855312.1 hypothetical protein DPMN_097878 [Dreissena polymorpha]
MSGRSRGVLSRFLEQSIVKLCREAVTYRSRLEIEGVLCVSVDDGNEHVIKIREVFTQECNGDNEENLKSRRQEINEYQSNTLQSPAILLGLANMPDETILLQRGQKDSNGKYSSISSQLFEMPTTSKGTQDDTQENEIDVECKSMAKHSGKETLSSEPETVDLDKIAISTAKDILCKKCGETLADVNAFDTHNITSHGHFTCLICLSTFTSRNNMKRHIRLHTGVKPYRCHKCSESFSRNDDFKRHLLRHTFQKPYRCVACQTGYADRTGVKTHMMKEHGTNVFHACTICGECFTDARKFQEHRETHTESQEYRCSLCAFIGSNALMYNKHMLTHGGQRKFSCAHCSLTYTDPFSYTSHVKKHKGDPSVTSFQCCFCEVVLASYEQFQRHEHSHLQSKQHTCNICKKHFRYPYNLREHMLTHIPKNELIGRADGQNETSNLSEWSPSTDDETVDKSHESLTDIDNDKGDMEENNNVIELPVSANDEKERSYDEDKNGSSEYWCTECNHGFGTEHELQEHIIMRHEHGPEGPANHQSADDMIGDANVFSRRAHSATENYIPAFSYILPSCLEEGNSSPPLASSHWSHAERDSLATVSHLTHKRKSGLTPERKIKHSRLEHQNGRLSVGEELQGLLYQTGRSSDFALKDNISTDVVTTPKSKRAITTSLEGMKLKICLEHDSNADSSTMQSDISNISEDSFMEKDASFVCENSSDVGNKYSKSSVLGMDTNFSTVTNSNSPTSINLKVRNPGFEKVITPEVLFNTKAPFTCEVCDETYSDFGSFDTHGVKVHRRFLCSYCGKAFTSRPNRERHVRYHTGEKPYRCDICPASFFRGDDLKYHRTTKHVDVKPFLCGVCQTSFCFPKELEKHLRLNPDHKSSV